MSYLQAVRMVIVTRSVPNVASPEAKRVVRKVGFTTVHPVQAVTLMISSMVTTAVITAALVERREERKVDLVVVSLIAKLFVYLLRAIRIRSALEAIAAAIQLRSVLDPIVANANHLLIATDRDDLIAALKNHHHHRRSMDMVIK